MDLRRDPEKLHPCFAAGSPVECSHPADWEVHTTAGSYWVCDKHSRLVALKLERAGLEPRLEPVNPIATPPLGRFEAGAPRH